MPLQLRVFLAVVGSGVAVLIVYSIVTGPLFHPDPFEGRDVLQFSGKVREQGTGKPMPGVFVVVNISSWRAAPFGNGASSCLDGSQVVRTDSRGDYRVAVDWWRHGWPVPKNVDVQLNIYLPSEKRFMVVGESAIYSARRRQSFELKPDARPLVDRLRMLDNVLDYNCEMTAFGETYRPMARAVHDEVWRGVCVNDVAVTLDELMLANKVMGHAGFYFRSLYTREDDAQFHASEDAFLAMLPEARSWSEPRLDDPPHVSAPVPDAVRRLLCDSLRPELLFPKRRSRDVLENTHNPQVPDRPIAIEPRKRLDV